MTTPRWRAFADACDVVTYEFENLPGRAARGAGRQAPARAPAASRLRRTARSRKRFLEANGARVAAWREVGSVERAGRGGRARSACRLVLKSRRLGYDGKGQAWVRDSGRSARGLGEHRRCPRGGRGGGRFRRRILGADRPRGRWTRPAPFPCPRNDHRDGILRRSTVPAGAPIDGLAEDAVATAATLADALDHVGMFTVEFFACRRRRRWSTKSRRASTTAATGRSRARRPRNSSSMSAPSAAFRWAAPTWSRAGAVMDNLIGDDVDSLGRHAGRCRGARSTSTTRAKRARDARWATSPD